MALIRSPHNQHVKLYRSLLQKKGRQESGLCPLEGVRLIEAALDNGARLSSLYVSDELIADERGRALVERAAREGLPVLQLSADVFVGMTDTQHPQGLAATAHIELHALADMALPTTATYLWLHELRDPGNLGTIFRSAAAFHVDGIILLGHCADTYNPKVIRASSGAIFAVSAAAASWDEARRWAEDNDVGIIAATLSAPALCHDVSYPARAALLIGSEAHGLPDALLTVAHLQVRIPMSDRVESLNAGVTAGILLYEVWRQRASSDRGCDGEK